MSKTDEFNIEEYIKSWQGHQNTRDDVSKCLKGIAPAGEKQDIKREVISKVFTKASVQGIRVVDTLGMYQEY